MRNGQQHIAQMLQQITDLLAESRRTPHINPIITSTEQNPRQGMA